MKYEGVEGNNDADMVSGLGEEGVDSVKNYFLL